MMNKKLLKEKLKNEEYDECILILREEMINILTDKIKKEDSYFEFSTTKDLYNKAKITLTLNEIQVAYKLYTFDTMYEVDKYVLDQMLEMYQDLPKD